jgi:hypothetical protein
VHSPISKIFLSYTPVRSLCDRIWCALIVLRERGGAVCVLLIYLYEDVSRFLSMQEARVCVAHSCNFLCLLNYANDGARSRIDGGGLLYRLSRVAFVFI